MRFTGAEKAGCGNAMTPLPALVVAGTKAAAAAVAFVPDMVKVPVLARLKIA